MIGDDNLQIKFGADTAGLKTGEEQAKAAITNIGASVKGLVDGFMLLGGAARHSFSEVREGAMEAAEHVKGAAESVTLFREAIAGIGEAMLAAFAVEQLTEFAKKMGETAEATYHTALTFGLTTSEVQRMNAMAAGAGVPAEALSTGMMRLDRAMMMAREGSTQAADAFKAIGINIKEPMTQTQLLSETLEHLGEMEAGPAKVAVAMALFGRNIQAIGPLLNMTHEQMEELNETISASGAVNDKAEQKGLALAEAFNTQKIAMMGLGNVMTDAMAPVLAQIVNEITRLIQGFVKSYQEGGIAKTVMDSLATSLRFAAAATAIFMAALDVAITPLVAAYHGALALWNAVRGNAAAAAAEGKKALDTFAEGARNAAATFVTAKNLITGENLKLPELPKAGKGTTADDPAGRKKKAPAEDAISKLREQFEAEANAHNDMIRDMTAAELAFWQKVAAGPQMAALNAKQQGEVRLMIGRLTHQEAMTQIREELAEARNAANDHIALIKDQAQQVKDATQEQVKAVEDAEKNGLLSHRQASAQIIALYREEQRAALEAAQQIYAARIAADQAIMARSERTTAEYKAAQRDEVAANAERNRAIVKANDDASKQIQAQNQREMDALRQQWSGYISPTVRSFSDGIKGMMKGTETFGQAVERIGESILDTFTNIAERMVERWLVNLIIGETAQKTSAISQVAANAGVAGAAGVASMAGAPFPIDLGAPAFGASMAATAMSYAGLASAAGGWENVPADDYPTLLHKQEMVLPATIANPLRAALRGANLAPASNRGDTNVNLNHSPTINGGSSQDIVRQLEASKRDFARLLKGMARDGHFKPA